MSLSEEQLWSFYHIIYLEENETEVAETEPVEHAGEKRV
jgi:hypothetical protein